MGRRRAAPESMTCATCLNWEPKKAGPMAKHHYCPCSKGMKGQFTSPTHTCPKHKRAEESVINARVVWLGKSAK